MDKICCIFNIPSLYREAIYLKIDQSYDCDWFFENEVSDIALFDTNQLKSVHFLEHGHFMGRLYRMKGLVKAVWKRKDYDSYLMVGAPMCVSIWILCLLLKVIFPKKRVFFWTHGWYGKESLMERIIKKRFLKLADELILYGDYAKSLLVERGFKSEKMHVIHNSLSYDVQLALRQQMRPSSIYRDHFGNSFPTLIFIGRLTPVKNLGLLLDAISKLNQIGDKYNLVFVGDGSEKNFLEHKVQEMGLDKQVWFYGACYDETVNSELVFNADICVAPGNIGLTAIHVLMFGCPAITHNDFTHQMPEFEVIKPYRTGAFFDRGDVASLAKVINEWFRINGSLRDVVRKFCYEEIDESWNPHFQMSVFKQVLG